MRSENRLAAKKRPIVAEIIGPAGVGKSTLLQTLSQSSNEVQIDIPLTKIKCIKPFIDNNFALLPIYFRYYRHTRWFNNTETRSMVYLKAWQRLIEGQATNIHSVTVLDHGPIFRLVLLREFGPEITHSQRYQEWWREMFKKWSDTLNFVIWLDAPDEILMERIQTRSVSHRMKEKSEQEIFSFLKRYRTAYERFMAQLLIHQDQEILKFDTSHKTPEEMADEVLAALDLEPIVG